MTTKIREAKDRPQEQAARDVEQRALLPHPLSRTKMDTWKKICALNDIPQLGSRVVKSTQHGDIAIFRTSEDEVFALHDKCPHKQGPLSQGIVHGRTVTCPLHSWKIGLDNGEAQSPDTGCTRPFSAKVQDGEVFLSLG